MSQDFELLFSRMADRQPPRNRTPDPRVMPRRGSRAAMMLPEMTEWTTVEKLATKFGMTREGMYQRLMKMRAAGFAERRLIGGYVRRAEWRATGKVK